MFGHCHCYCSCPSKIAKELSGSWLQPLQVDCLPSRLKRIYQWDILKGLCKNYGVGHGSVPCRPLFFTKYLLCFTSNFKEILFCLKPCLILNTLSRKMWMMTEKKKNSLSLWTRPDQTIYLPLYLLVVFRLFEHFKVFNACNYVLILCTFQDIGIRGWTSRIWLR